MTRMTWLAALLLAAPASIAAAQARPKAAAAADDELVIEDEADPAPPAEPAPARPSDPPPGQARSGGKLIQQDLTGHDQGTAKSENVFARDLFFSDKSDTAETEKGTLVQGSLTSSSFGYHEEGGNVVAALPDALVPSASPYNRLFTDLRLQTDLRHISGGRWDARIDVRGRLVGSVEARSRAGFMPGTDPSIQSGLLGENELEIKELWLVRNGRRSDVFFGRQFVADLGGVRFDGLRIDYASSEKLTLLGFGGLYPIRGSRSITDDYTTLRSDPDPMDGTRTAAGRFTGAGGLGAAYRTANTYGSFGGVVLAPLTSAESPRIYATSTGYWRLGSKLDFYHLAILDIVGSNAVNTGLTNLSLGLNWKPDQRLRGTLAFHRVDTETLNVQAQAFLNDPTADVTIIDNEAFIKRIATNQARASLSAGLGELQRVELTAAIAYRFRGEVTLTPFDPAGDPTVLPAAQSVEVYGSITDRRSFAKLRIGVDASQVFGVGDSTYQRTTSTTARLFLGREIANGRGEWELEGSASFNEDDGIGIDCDGGDLLTCFGAAKSTVISGGGSLFFRLSRSWFTMASAFVHNTAITHTKSEGSDVDPPVLGVSGFLRIAFRF